MPSDAILAMVDESEPDGRTGKAVPTGRTATHTGWPGPTNRLVRALVLTIRGWGAGRFAGGVARGLPHEALLPQDGGMRMAVATVPASSRRRRPIVDRRFR